MTGVDTLLSPFDTEGFVAMYHPFRGSDNTSDRGFWRRFLGDALTNTDRRSALTFSPHVHIIAVAERLNLRTVSDIHDRTEWVIHRITDDDSSVSLYGPVDLAAALTDGLSHVGLLDDTRPLIWMRGGVATTLPTAKAQSKVLRGVQTVAEDTLPLTVSATPGTN